MTAWDRRLRASLRFVGFGLRRGSSALHHRRLRVSTGFADSVSLSTSGFGALHHCGVVSANPEKNTKKRNEEEDSWIHLTIGASFVCEGFAVLACSSSRILKIGSALFYVLSWILVSGFCLVFAD